MQEAIIALGRRVIINKIDVCLRIVMIHLIIPCHCVNTPNNTAIEYWELPILTIINLPSTR